MFSTVYRRAKTVSSVSGEKTRPNYKPMYDDKGNYTLVPNGVFNSYDDIQSYADSCDLSLIMERYNMTGDASLLNKRHGFYEDVTDMPANYAELQNMLIDADNKFNALPLEIREKFGQDPARFYMSIGTPEFAELMNIKASVDGAPETAVASTETTPGGDE